MDLKEVIKKTELESGLNFKEIFSKEEQEEILKLMRDLDNKIK